MLGILRHASRQAVFYASAFFWLDGFAVPAPARLTQTVRQLTFFLKRKPRMASRKHRLTRNLWPLARATLMPALAAAIRTLAMGTHGVRSDHPLPAGARTIGGGNLTRWSMDQADRNEVKGVYGFTVCRENICTQTLFFSQQPP